MEEGTYLIKRVRKLPKKGNANYLYFIKGDIVDKLYRWNNTRGSYDEILIGSKSSLVTLSNEYTDFPTAPTTQEEFNQSIIDLVNSGSGGGNTGNQRVTVTISDAQINFDGTDNTYIELIPAQAGHIIFVKSILIERLLTSPVQQSYVQAYVGYDLAISGSTLDLLSIQLDNTEDLITYENSISIFQQSSNFYDQPIGVPLVIKGEDGIGMTGGAGDIHITIEFEYYTAFKQDVPH